MNGQYIYKKDDYKQKNKKHDCFENIIMIFLIIICFSIIILIFYIIWTVYNKGNFYFKIRI